MKYLWIAMALFFSGCTIQTVVPSATEYRLEPNLKTETSDCQACLKKSLKVARLHTPDQYMLRTIYYGHGEMEQYSFAYAKWAQPLHERLEQLFVSHVAESGYFSNVLSHKVTVSTDYVLQVTLNDFMQYFDEDGSYVRLNIDLLLLNDKGNKITDSRHIELVEPVGSEDVEGGVAAMNVLLEKALSETATWLGGHCE